MTPALLDTDILSYFLNGDGNVLRNAANYLESNFQLQFSEITYYEILAGLEYKNAEAQKRKFELFTKECQLIKLSTESIRISAQVYGDLRRRGIQVGSADLLIAGIALSNNMQLVTNNEKHFSAIQNLRMANWTK